MSRTRMNLASLLAAGLVLAGCAPASVEEEIAALHDRVDELEQKVQALGSGAGSNALEAEAKAAYTALSQLVSAGKIDEAKARVDSIGTKYASTQIGRRIQSLARELEVVGKSLPPSWGIEKWFQGEQAIDLESDGTMVVVFWETWCPHCRREVPKLQEIYAKYKDQGLQVIGLTRLTRSATEDAVQDIIAQNSLKYPIAKEDGSLANYFAVSGIPAAAVVKDRKVVWRGHPARITPTMLENWLTS